MKKITIYEAAMCCPTGLCGVGVDPELLRISTVVNALKKKGIVVNRYNLTSSPMKFMTNQTVNKMINDDGVDNLPFTLVDEEVLITGRYPTNEELANLLELPVNFIDEEIDSNK
ncbi:MAG: arsenite efflux transporter metallochaperone ArsD [Sphaerochaetaceae bacterium]|nr:arsenite efflux transporter metallochaperone ArsD [Sphaerochaetaceae bacterium]MDC7238703.1 arsenite efflux transporter metallochaperone ArsD [Sphaerochaetaceae bacterium]MDC7242428.1 arsenite efflux transporter metallochaperone ArsD [Sphaerochaetaceae bacterium]